MRFLSAAAVLLSTALLFQAPLISARFFLPWFSGATGIWNVTLAFLFVAILVGFLYAAASIRLLKLRAQAFVHGGLLAIAALYALLFPMAPGVELAPTPDTTPIRFLLTVLLRTIGPECSLLAATALLVPVWSSVRNQTAGHSRLYPIGFGGAISCVLVYPFLIEHCLRPRVQASIWTGLFVLAAAVTATVALSVRHPAPALELSHTPAERRSPDLLSYLKWMLLASVPAALLLVVTARLSRSLGASPFIWGLSLAVYLLTLLICLTTDGWQWKRSQLPIPALGIAGLMCGLVRSDMDAGAGFLLITFLGGLFACSLLCHGELARRKPPPQHLTAFYLCLSVGVALGGISIAIVAPHLFRNNWDLSLAIDASILIGLFTIYRDQNTSFRDPAWIGLAILLFIISSNVDGNIRERIDNYRLAERDFYGTIRVADYRGVGSHSPPYRTVADEAYIYGSQTLDRRRRNEPTPPYEANSGVGRTIQVTRSGSTAETGQRVGIIGMGAGAAAAYGRLGDRYWFFELRPSLINIAQTQFAFSADSEAVVETVMGGQRPALDRMPSLQLDVLVLDPLAFGAPPISLLTQEAFQTYFRHLKPTGVLCINVSRGKLRLQPIVAQIGKSLGKETLLVKSAAGGRHSVISTWLLVTSNQAFLNDPRIRNEASEPDTDASLKKWTDDDADIFTALRW